MRILWQQDRLRHVLKLVGLIAFGGYAVWNASWLLRGHIPPSIFSHFTGLPCPTTGMTRSVVLLLRGAVVASLLQNPLTFVYLGLIGLSMLILMNHLCHGRSVALPRWMGWTWAIVLVLGWTLKFAMGSQYW